MRHRAAESSIRNREDGLRYTQTGDGPIVDCVGRLVLPFHPDYAHAVGWLSTAKDHAIVTGSQGCNYDGYYWQRDGRHAARLAVLDDRAAYDEEGSATEHVVVAVLLAMSALVFLLAVLAWWAPAAQATRVVPGSGWEQVDRCDNRRGVQTILDVTTGHRFRVVHVTADGRTICRKVVVR